MDRRPDSNDLADDDFVLLLDEEPLGSLERRLLDEDEVVLVEDLLPLREDPDSLLFLLGEESPSSSSRVRFFTAELIMVNEMCTATDG